MHRLLREEPHSGGGGQEPAGDQHEEYSVRAEEADREEVQGPARAKRAADDALQCDRGAAGENRD